MLALPRVSGSVAKGQGKAQAKPQAAAIAVAQAQASKGAQTPMKAPQ